MDSLTKSMVEYYTGSCEAQITSARVEIEDLNSTVKVGDFAIINRCLCRINKIGKMKIYFDEYDSYPLHNGVWIYKNKIYNTTKHYKKYCPCILIPNTDDLFKYPFKIENNRFIEFIKTQPFDY